MSNSVILLIKTVILRLKMSKLPNLQKVKTVVRQCQNGHFKTATVKIIIIIPFVKIIILRLKLSELKKKNLSSLLEIKMVD